MFCPLDWFLSGLDWWLEVAHAIVAPDHPPYPTQEDIDAYILDVACAIAGA